MAEHFPQLATHFPGNPETRLNRSGSDALSAFEREFVHAIRCRQLFPVFQPIVDSHHRLQGMEILSRWRREGTVLQPGAFLPQIRAEYARQVLTAFVLQEAIQKINQHPGSFISHLISLPPSPAMNAFHECWKRRNSNWCRHSKRTDWCWNLLRPSSSVKGKNRREHRQIKTARLSDYAR